MGCKAELKFRASADGQHLELRSMNEIHNHEINETVFRNLFQQRRLDKDAKENVQSLLSVRANKKMIQTRVMEETGKVVKLKDIHNIKATNKSPNSDMTMLQAGVENFSQSPGAFVKIVTNEQNEMRGLFFQDSRMR